MYIYTCVYIYVSGTDTDKGNDGEEEIIAASGAR